MAPQLTAASAFSHSSLLRLPLSLSPPPFRNKDLAPERCTTTCLKRNYAMPFASMSLGKSSTQLNTTVSSPLFTDNEARLSLNTPLSQRFSKIHGQAYIYHNSGFRIPANAERPEWWWRTLSCIPYLIAMHMSATGYYLGPLMEKFPLFENLVYYIPGAVNRLPTWFPILYCYLAIVFVVKNRKFPLLFRFHLMMGMLLEIAQQIVWVSSNFMPLIHFKGTLGVYYWAGVAVTYILVMMQCIRCALLGTFVKIPMVSESAFVHSIFGVK
ncbi:PREDICTED: protein TIC 20-IV, chloroplastic-like isoform X1 [Lupinus angustifolius]|uniref:protein TIC 20-IV, chloroplastic-like isoform X1 n=1 Tax=Lupinus angustifolius TaxID=3871 RepID=UPI00092E7BF3|nr:PREDICTED: protein TIC 20-IV, chloroplastic-like isoform X1 [Lupinus angustifolius]